MSNLRDPLVSDEPSRDPVMKVASSTDLMEKTLQEYIIRLMFEHGSPRWVFRWQEVLAVAEEKARKEFNAAKIIKESREAEGAPF